MAGRTSQSSTMISAVLALASTGLASSVFCGYLRGRAGAVSRSGLSLARNGRDWHTLIEFCGLVGAVIIDEDGVYEPRHPNDRCCSA